MRTDKEPLHDDDAPEPAPRGVHVMAVVRWAILILMAVAAVGTWYKFARGEAGESASAVKYQCPMHPQIVSDQPGDCPICHMSLEPVSADRLKKPEAAHVHGAGSGAAPGSSAAPGAPGSTPPGVTQIELSLDRVQAIGVRTSVAEEQAAASRLRATATVQAPEQNVAEVHVRAPGFVEGISVNQTGVKVKAGQGLISIYSPEVYQAQSELLATRDWAALSPDGGAAQRGSAARQKLSLLGVGDQAADKILAQGKPFRTTGVSAPISGFVTKKNVVLGAYVTPEMPLYEIVDLSKVYVVADVFQQNLSQLSVGTEGRFTSSSRSAPSVDAKIDLIYPQVSAEARTTRVRMQVQNKDLGLLPGEYGTVEFSGQAQPAVLVPRDAVIDTGRQVYVFVEDAPGRFTPRIIELGPEAGEKLEVRAGLAKGEKVVSGATFLVDAESRLQASLAGN